MSEILGRKLSDRIMTDSVFIHANSGPRVEQFKSEEDRLKIILRRSPVFYIQEVVEYLSAYLQENEVWSANDLPCIAPPFPSFFTEFRLRPGSGGYNGGYRKAGVLFEAAQNPKPNPDRLDPSKPKWRLQATVMAEDREDKPWALTRYELHVAENGTLIGSETNRCHLMADLFGGKSMISEEGKGALLQATMNDAIFPGLLAVTFSHVKGTRVREEEPPIKLSRKHEARTGRPLAKYKVIDIHPMRNLLLREGEIETQGLQRALHLVRGHFADYRERGLFGRNKGIFWFPDHIKGTAEAGVVVKDYNVEAPILSV